MVVAAVWLPVGATAATDARAANPIVRENQHAGTDRWDIPWPGYKITDDRRLNIKGYATAVSVLQGGDIGLRDHDGEAHEPYTVDVYRLGYYHGHGGRHVAQLGPFDGVAAARVLHHAARPAWSRARGHTSVDAATSPTSWTSGVYFAVLTTASKFQSEILFTVRDDASGRHRLRVAGQHVPGVQQLPVRPTGGHGLELRRPPAHGPQPVRLQQPDDAEVPGRQARREGLVRPALQLPVRQPRERRPHRLRAVHDRVPGEARLRRHLHHRRRRRRASARRCCTTRSSWSPGTPSTGPSAMYDGAYAARDAGVNLVVHRVERDLLAGALRAERRRALATGSWWATRTSSPTRSTDPALRTI